VVICGGVDHGSQRAPCLTADKQYADRLRREGTADSDPAFQAKLNAYQQRLPAMNQQRSYPETPPFACQSSSDPMNKIRHIRWPTGTRKPFSARSELMAEHATSGIRFAGKVSQLITASTGFE
jgi:chlorite dismutase